MDYFQGKSISTVGGKEGKNGHYYLEENRVSQKYNQSKKKLSWKRLVKYYKWRLLRLREHPHAIARGFAVGIFAGCLPLMGLQFVISLLLAFMVRGNKFTAILGTWISNPFTYVPLFFFNFHVGKLILGFFRDNQNLAINWQSWRDFAQMGREITITLLFGSVIVGVIFGAIAYYLILRLLAHWRKYN